MNPSSCPLPCSRRHFITRVAACAGCATGLSLLSPKPVFGANSAAAGKPRVRVIFCETTNNKPIWPNVGYDFAARRAQVIRALTQGCPDIDLSMATVMDDPKHADEVLKEASGIDGYVVCLQGLGWNNDAVKLCTTGKPTLLVDNLFGGSGLFLSRQPEIMHSGKPVDWVSSSRDEDMVASARKFALLSEGKSPKEVAEAFRATRRQRTPGNRDMTCQPDPLPAIDFEQGFRKLGQTKILVVGGGWGGVEFRKAAASVTGVQFIEIDFKELAAAYEEAESGPAREFADSWMHQAEKIMEPSREEIIKSGRMFVGMKNLLRKHDARGISVNCLGGFYAGHLKAFPCLGFAHLNNLGLVGGCEADQMSALTMSVMTTLTGRPGFISDPVIDTSRNSIIYAHCVAMTKPFGTEGKGAPYRIRDHSEDRKGAAIQALLPTGYMTTTLEINPVSKQVLLHRAKAIDNNPSDMACRTKLEAVVKGDIEKLTENWRMGWHRVTFYGDLADCVKELATRWKLEVIEEA
jgi:hypothetical protein